MFKLIVCTILLASVLNTSSFLFGGEAWDDLKVTWGINPLDSTALNSLPRTETDAKNQGWVLEKDCSEVNGNRYILNNDPAVLLIFDHKGIIAGIACKIPKGLPFDFPSVEQQEYFTNEGDSYVISAYFTDPNLVCSKIAQRLSTGDRLVIKGDKKTLNIPMDEADIISEKFFTQGRCFFTMGQHYWADLQGIPLDENVELKNFLPLFALYNKGKLNGFGWAFNADFKSTRFEHPTIDSIEYFFHSPPPPGLSDPTQSAGLSTMHIYMDSTPLLNYC